MAEYLTRLKLIWVWDFIYLLFLFILIYVFNINTGCLVFNITKQNFLLLEGGRANIFYPQKQITLAIGIFEYKIFVRLYNVHCVCVCCFFVIFFFLNMKLH